MSTASATGQEARVPGQRDKRRGLLYFDALESWQPNAWLTAGNTYKPNSHASGLSGPCPTSRSRRLW
jgi:hypothetical protein